MSLHNSNCLFDELFDCEKCKLNKLCFEKIFIFFCYNSHCSYNNERLLSDSLIAIRRLNGLHSILTVITVHTNKVIKKTIRIVNVTH